MAITYPIDFPTSFGVSKFSIGLDHAVAVSESEFTFAQQTQEHQGTAWEITATINLLDRDQAEEYNAFLIMLGGRKGVFTMSVPGSENPRGTITGTPLVNGENQTGQELVVDGLDVSTAGVLKTGDYFQLGSGLNTTLHKILLGVDSDENGEATILFAPKIITAPEDDAELTVVNPKGLFRLKSNLLPVSIKSPNIHSLSFSAREVK